MLETQDEAVVRQAVERLSRPGAWLDGDGGRYRVRTGADRRRRPLMTLDEAAFAALVRHPGLAPRREGGWRLVQAGCAAPPPPPPGRPGVIEGERVVIEADGRITPRRANLGASALAWLAGRRDANGRPWLEPRHLSAAERLSADHEMAGVIGRLTMSWDAGPKGGAARGRGVEPAERARAAKARLAAALAALDPGERAVVERIVLAEHPLEAVERHLGLPRRTAKTVLKAGLQRLAAHYRIG